MRAPIISQMESALDSSTGGVPYTHPHRHGSGGTTVGRAVAKSSAGDDRSFAAASVYDMSIDLEIPDTLEAALESIEDTHVEGEALLWRGVEEFGQRGADEASAAGAALDEEEAAEDAKMLRALEVQVWLELDALSTELEYESVPLELLGLLPPPPEGVGWPLSFAQQRAAVRFADAEEQRVRAEASGDGAAAAPASAFVAADSERYPALRRATKLSYAIWAVIRDGDEPVQHVLEAASTSERLRLALLRLREISGRV